MSQTLSWKSDKPYDPTSFPVSNGSKTSVCETLMAGIPREQSGRVVCVRGMVFPSTLLIRVTLTNPGHL